MMRSETCPDCPCPLTPPEVRKLWGPRSSTLLRSAANTSPARHVRPGRATSKASSESSTPRLRSFPTFSSRVSTAAGCGTRSEEHTSELQSRLHLVCRLLLEKKNQLEDPPQVFFLPGLLPGRL